VGQFRNWPGGKRGLIDEIGAAWIIYTTVLASWIFVAGAGVASLSGVGLDGWRSSSASSWGSFI